MAYSLQANNSSGLMNILSSLYKNNDMSNRFAPLEILCDTVDIIMI